MKPRLIVEQKITAFANKYAIYVAEADGSKGRLLAFAQQKRLAFKEKVTFYADEQKTQPIFTFRAEKVMDIHGRYFVEDMSGVLVGMFKKDFTHSLVNSTWHILGADGAPRLTIAESNAALAFLRRYGGYLPVVGIVFDLITTFLRYHFNFVASATNQVVGHYQKTTLIRDHYRLEMTDEGLAQADWRVIVAMTVALDALQSR